MDDNSYDLLELLVLLLQVILLLMISQRHLDYAVDYYLILLLIKELVYLRYIQ